MFVPSMLLKQLYTRGSLENTANGLSFLLKNRLKDAKIKELISIKVNGHEFLPEDISIQISGKESIQASEIPKMEHLAFPLRSVAQFHLNHDQSLPFDKHHIEISFLASPFGKLSFHVEDAISKCTKHMNRLPRDPVNDYSDEIIKQRQQYIASNTQSSLENISQYSVAPSSLSGNIESFTGIAQVPMGFAGPIQVNGQKAQGEFLIPLATTEGTLVASYNRGIKVANLCGGIKATVVDDAMQRAPVFVFNDAREALNFEKWLRKHFAEIKEHAEATSSIAKLVYIDSFLASKFVYCRFNFKTGDAAGQNMVGRATFAGCSWILDHYQGIEKFYLESNFATDKKASQINIMRTRGKRVTAEVTLSRDVLIQHMRVEPEQLDYHARVAGVGSFLSGVNNTGLHSPNGITAMFIATGQDVANVAESSAGILYTEITDEGDLYLSLTIPSLIVATYGGGTGLATQKEALQVMDCYGKDRVIKFAEIIAAVALAGEISLASAISSSDWVSSHEKYGRNR